ncbi:choice-of-anchor D domain-containing protein [Flavobacterium limnophilum]|uniref:choice-of-anchor D domain-containing protein n=1 Tax=Flavobacterium limnophilum TaxID=3003262 RepID=UPI0024831AD8|nr:choice-of-anchor D domain-containing protein [Flavobacterium limnophilum]
MNIIPLSKKTILSLFILLCSVFGMAQTIVTDNTPGGTEIFTVPADVTSVTVEVWGGGGTGGSRTSASSAGGGGGGGAYSRSVLSVTGGTNINYFVGAGAAAVTGTNGLAGQDSWFSSNTTVMAKGGSSGLNNSTNGAAGGDVASGYGDVKYSGGTGGTGSNSNRGGGGGSSAGSAANGNNGSNSSPPLGGIAPIDGGNGADGPTVTGTAGSPGFSPGGGGSASLRATTNIASGAGANGQVRITYITSGSPEINIQGNATNIADGATGTSTTNHTDFGTTNTGTPVTRTYTIQNTGAGALSIGTITLGDPTNYSVTTPPAASVAAGGSTTFIVTFNPTTGGVKPSTISIVNGDSDENPYNFALTGTGVAVPEINIQGNSNNIADGTSVTSTTNRTDFGTTPIGTPVAYTYTIQNTGSATLTIGAITLGDLTNYTLTTAPAASIAAGGTTTFVVTFTPTVGMALPTTISIVNGDGDENPYDFALTGTGVTVPEINIQGNATNIADGETATSPTDHTDFGTTNTGTPVTRTYTIQNTGAGALSIGTITLGDPTNYSVTTPPAASVAAGGSTTFVVTFNPTTGGVKPSTISIVNGDSDENPYNFALTGTGVAVPEINIQGNSNNIADGTSVTSTTNQTDFGTTPIGTPVAYTYTIQNIGSATLTIGAITLGDLTNYTLTTPPAASIIAGGTTTFVVTFNPTTAGIKPSTISIENGDSDENPYNFALTGTTPPEMNITGNGNSIVDGDSTPTTTDDTDFGATNTGTAVSHTFTIQNTGTGTLTLGSTTLGDLTNYKIFLPAASIAPGGSTTFTIIFNPTTAGTKTTTFSIVTNDGDENPYNFSITGFGVAATEIDIYGNGVAINDGSTSPLTTNWTNFGSADYTLESIVKTFTIRNTGATTLNISSATLSGSSDFTITTPPAATVASGTNTTITITFNPSSLGVKNATVTILSDDLNEATYDFAIQGFGIQTYYDSDGDGVDDNVDIDDDNDGILDATEETNCNLSNGTKSNYKFLNETFGTGGRTTINTTYAAETTYCYEDGSIEASTAACPKLNEYSVDDGEYSVSSTAKISQWSDGTTNTKWYQGDDHTTGDTNGRMAIFNASPIAGQVFYTATIKGTLSNVPITYSFWALNLDRIDDPNIATRTRPNIKVEFKDMNDVVLQTINTGDIAPSGLTPSASDWHQFTANLTLSVSSFKVVFTNNNGNAGSGNDLAIDDISINQSLCDYDSDSIADLFDLDSDNDGIPDVVEAGLGQYSNGKGKMDIGSVGTDGLNTNASAASGLPTLDSDGDGIPNTLDLDSDNDSVFDVDESGAGNSNAVTGYINGDGDITGDGMAEGPDTEAFREKDSDGNGIIEYIGDGILDIYDYGTGMLFANQYGNSGQGVATGVPATDYLKDTDGDGTPDYLDVTSNGSTHDIANNKLIYAPKVLDGNNDGILDTSADADKDGILDIFDTNTTVKGSPRNLDNKLYLDFDGRNDYAQDVAVLAGSAGSLMAWIDLNSAFASEGFVVGQDSFHLKITSGRILQVSCNGTTLSSPTALDRQRWYHVAATYSANNLNLYLNGVKIATSATPTGTIADSSLLTIGRSPSASANFFKGKVDEVRVFNVGLTDNQVQRMVYQEIDPTSSNLKGTYITGKEIAQNLTTSTAGTLTFTTMLRYYRMDAFKDDIIDNLSTPAIDIAGTKIYNHKNIHLQQAPMPFVTLADGDLATSITDATKDIQGTDVNNYNTIVNVKHNNTTTVSRTDIGLFVDSGKSLTVNNDQGLTNKWWVKLDGKIDLAGMSQLVQNSTSDLDVTSSGFIERDQQGQSNLYNYNYWSSPVSPINTTANNTNYTVDGMMKDGFNSIPRNINWISGYDGVAGNAGTPVSLARYWLYKFDNNTDAYPNWVPFLETDALRVGQGYILKGSGAATHFTFVGKPNNGILNSNTVTADNLLLVGNPYPSALDGHQFINDNIGSVNQGIGDGSVTDGTLYFWEHAPENNTHVLAGYVGGYAVLNLLGGLPPVAPSLISGAGSSSKVPQQYIPVGQGFFVYGSASGGSVIFNNGQRAFVKETDATSNTLFKTKNNNKISKVQYDNNSVPKKYKKIRLGYNTNDGYHRQVLLGFAEDKATNHIDYGYDAEIMDDLPNDMFLLNGNKQLVIEGEGCFDENASFPIGIKADKAGKVSFVIDGIENFTPEQPIYIYDNTNDTYHNIRSNPFEVVLKTQPATLVNTRFSLRFKDKTLGVDENTIAENGIKISHSQKGNLLEINNQLVDTGIEKVTLYTIAGQSITTWKIENPAQQNIQLPLKNSSSGVYVVKIKTSKGVLSQKIIVK